ncbi:CDP-alcohol phosphatidyltransferase family protein [Actinoplanes sp. N902-109]|uniref:CDP-alcohol phosphatidyltransferase family protein n=1 Tax=Actinoplanes sp. (strain N902-109) TaxID=649831 RepID=UPI0003296071|nr:CDP-alcohol phosphatidyltransferase family protein [Actinoplanes sp. N902-109]AGL20083.1 CDP-alcohol phosphatidyltransferase [Actinoplanes sp. N902-109]
MVRRSSLREIREQTYKARDAWWTVLLVDPVAVRLVWLVSPYRRITPNVLTGVATVLGLGAAAAFAMADRWWVVAGALLFHLSFIVDCMDGKIARLNGTGSMFGTWLDFMFDRVRVFICALALFGGQYARTGSETYMWVMIAVVFLDLFRYLNGQQMAKVRLVMREQIAEARGAALPPSGEAAVPAPTGGPRARVRHLLLTRRIRTHLFSGIEYEMTVFIIGPLTGLIIPFAVLAGALMLVFELRLIFRLWQATRAFPVALAKARAAAAVRPVPEQSHDVATTPTRG